MGVSVEPVYTLLKKLEMVPVRMEGRQMLVPCADRSRRVFAKALAPLLSGEVREIGVPCCGGGGEASVLEPGLAAALKRAVRQQVRDERVLTTCTQCALTLTKAGIATDHALSVLLGCRERARTGLGQMKALGQTIMAVAGLSLPADEGAGKKGLAARLLGRLGRKEAAGAAADARAAAAPGLDIHMDDRSEIASAPKSQESRERPAQAAEVSASDRVSVQDSTPLSFGDGQTAREESSQAEEKPQAADLPEADLPEADRLGEKGAVRLAGLQGAAETPDRTEGQEGPAEAAVAAGSDTSADTEAATVSETVQTAAAHTVAETAAEPATNVQVAPDVQAGAARAEEEAGEAGQDPGSEAPQSEAVQPEAVSVDVSQPEAVQAEAAGEAARQGAESDAAAAGGQAGTASADAGDQKDAATAAPAAEAVTTEAAGATPEAAAMVADPEAAATAAEAGQKAAEQGEIGQNAPGQSEPEQPGAGQGEAGQPEAVPTETLPTAAVQSEAEQSQTERLLTEDSQPQAPRLRSAVSLKDYKKH